MSTDAGRFWRELTRTARRHRALLAGGLAAGAVATALPVLAPPAPETLGVVAAARDLLPGRPLTADDLRLVALPVLTAPMGAVTDVEQVLGRTLSGPVRSGEALTDVRLLGSGLVRGRGLVAVPVRLADAATTGLLRVGDRVDVLAAHTHGGDAPARTVAAGLEVLAVPGDSDAEGALVVLAASPATAARLAGAAVSGRLSVTVLGPP